jgi:hypothetical protein
MVGSRSRTLAFALALATSGAVVLAEAAAAGRAAYQVHIQGRIGEGSKVLDVTVPWTPDKGGSPFDFTTDVSDDLALERLRKAWNTLQHLPPGTEVTIESDSETLRASRRGGYLVLEPHPDEQSDNTRIKIPDYIVNTILTRNGRLTDEDIARLVRDRGKVTLVKLVSAKGALDVWVGRSTGGST